MLGWALTCAGLAKSEGIHTLLLKFWFTVWEHSYNQLIQATDTAIYLKQRLPSGPFCIKFSLLCNSDGQWILIELGGKVSV